MKDLSKVIAQFSSLLDWLEDISREEEIETDFYSVYRSNESLIKVYARTQDLLGGTNLVTVLQAMFLGSSSSRLAKLFVDMEEGDFIRVLHDMHKFTGRMLSNRTTTLGNGSEVYEATRLFNNMKWLSTVVMAELNEAIPASVQGDQRKAQEIAFIHNEPLQLRSASELVEQTIRQTDDRSKKLTPRECRRRGLKKPPSDLLLSRNDSTTCQDQETGCSGSASESESTQSECCLDSELSDTPHDEEGSLSATSTM